MLIPIIDVLMRVSLSLFLFCWYAPAIGSEVIEPLHFERPELRERFQYLSSELRCPKCENQSLRESNAQVAQDLRKRLHQLLHEGYSDSRIRNYMRDRYGDFVLYRPRVSGVGLVLWLLPAVLVIMCLIGWWRWRVRLNTLVSAKMTQPPRTKHSASVTDELHARRIAMRHMRAVVVLVLVGTVVSVALLTDWSAWWTYHQLRDAITQGDRTRMLEVLRNYIDAP